MSLFLLPSFGIQPNFVSITESKIEEWDYEAVVVMDNVLTSAHLRERENKGKII